jgi:large subunit ribosomal protein LP2
MKHLAAYLLLTLGGNSSPSEKDIKTVLESVGIEGDDERLSALISELKGKDINEVHTPTNIIQYGLGLGKDWANTTK